MKVIAIDIGGTSIKYALVSHKGEVLHSGETPTEASKGVESLLWKIDNVVDEYRDPEVLGIAVSGTGQIDGDTGTVIGGSDIIPGWIGTPLVKVLEEKYGLPSILENDVNCAALGEKWLGAARGKKNFLCLTLGTGIGGGIVLKDELFRGENYVAGEFGHFRIKRDGRACACGKRGCYEAYASTSALVKMVYEKLGEILNGKEIFERCHEDNICKEIVEDWTDFITDGLETLSYIFNPSFIVIGGGVTRQGDWLLNNIREKLNKKLGENYRKNLNLVFAELGNNAGLLGATYLLLKKLGITHR